MVRKVNLRTEPSHGRGGTGVGEMDIDDDDGMWNRMIEKRMLRAQLAFLSESAQFVMHVAGAGNI